MACVWNETHKKDAFPGQKSKVVSLTPMPMTFVLFQVAHENCGSIEISEDELFREIALAMSTSGVINWEYKKYILLRF